MSVRLAPPVEPTADGYGDLPGLCRHPDPKVSLPARRALAACREIVDIAERCGVDTGPTDEVAVARILREARL